MQASLAEIEAEALRRERKIKEEAERRRQEVRNPIRSTYKKLLPYGI
jgi:hypothetical protein